MANYTKLDMSSAIISINFDADSTPLSRLRLCGR